MGKSVRLPGFRPGKVPTEVLRRRYGARARSEVVKQLAGEFGLRAVPKGGILSALSLSDGAEGGDLILSVTATSPTDLPTADFSSLTLERLAPETSAPDAQAMVDAYLRRQVLDFLAKIYEFPIAPLLVEREFTAILRAAKAQLELDQDNQGELTAEFRRIAERRIRLGVVVAEIARRHGIQVSDQEVRQVREAMPEAARASESPAQTRSRVLEDKVIAWIVARAQVKERRATMDELAAL